MAFVEWRMKGLEIANCNCAWGCPCQFDALPTHGNCRAMTGMRVDEGHFGDVSLVGTKWVGMFAWPKAIHEGHGEAAVVIDPSASEAQRNALLTILTGGETEPGATIFNIFSTTFETFHPPQFLPIDFALDLERRVGHLKVAGVLDTEVGPITNPVTGAEHRVRVSLPQGFEYHEAEYASGRSRSPGPIPLDFAGTHSHVATLNLSTRGPV